MTCVSPAFVVMRGPMTSLRSVYNLTDAPYERPTEAPSISVGPPFFSDLHRCCVFRVVMVYTHRSTTSSRTLMMMATAPSTSRSSTCSCTASASSSSASRRTN